MGLCKCPKRKVTNQFCYEHRVNVCEHCMITNHTRCVVLSYLKWLQDGDFNPICELCKKKLNENECIRLVCYHVFHWNCLDNYARQMPGTIAPAGYTCPSCKLHIFPSPNLVSPVADVLRKKFESVNWARTGLGLPSLVEEQTLRQTQSSTHFADESKAKHDNTVVEIETPSNNSYECTFHENVPRRLGHSAETKKLIPELDDHDDNKYVRRTMSERFGRFRRYATGSKYFHFYFRNRYRRILAVVMILFIGFFIFMLILEKILNRSSGEEPEYDPLFNPNIHVNDS